MARAPTSTALCPPVSTLGRRDLPGTPQVSVRVLVFDSHSHLRRCVQLTLPLYIGGLREARDLPKGTDSKAGTEVDEVNGRETVSVHFQYTIGDARNQKKGQVL